MRSWSQLNDTLSHSQPDSGRHLKIVEGEHRLPFLFQASSSVVIIERKVLYTSLTVPLQIDLDILICFVFQN